MDHTKINMFIRERLANDRLQGRITQDYFKRILEILDLHDQWPLLMRDRPEPAQIKTVTDFDTVRYSLIQTMEWSTQKSYKERFGEDPPTTPIVRSLALIWVDHEDFDNSWL